MSSVCRSYHYFLKIKKAIFKRPSIQVQQIKVKEEEIVELVLRYELGDVGKEN